MSTANFKCMKGFPLIVAEDVHAKVCPECGCSMGTDDDACSECGADLSSVSSSYDEPTMTDVELNMSVCANGINDGQDFFSVSVESGYYGGLQFFVEFKNCPVSAMDDDDAQYYYGISQEEALRRESAAREFVVKGLKNAAKELGLVELSVIGRASNGEVFYSMVA